MFTTDLPVNIADPINRSHHLNRGLLGWWLTLPQLAGGQTWYDLCGLNHATLTSFGSATGGSGWHWDGGVAGRRGCVRINDTTRGPHIVIPNPNGYFDTTSGTISMWLRSLAVGTWFSHYDIANKGGIGLYWSGTSPKLEAITFTGQIATSSAITLTGIDMTDGVWRHYVIKWTGLTAGVDQVAFNVNAAQSVLGTNTSNVVQSWGFAANQPLWFGLDHINNGTPVASSFPPVADYDDIRIWNRLLSDYEIFELYNESRLGYQDTLNYVRPSFFSAPAAPFDEPPKTSLVSVEPPRPYTGQVISFFGPPPPPATFDAPPPVIIARAESPRPYPGSVSESHAPAPPPPQFDNPPPVAIIRSEPPRPYPGASLWASAPPPPPVATDIPPAPLVAFSEAPRPYAGSVISFKGPPPRTPATVITSSAIITDSLTGRIILSNPCQGPAEVMYGPVDPDFPFDYVETPPSIILMANGVDPVLKWDPLTKKSTTAGVQKPTTALTLGSTTFVNHDAQGNVIPDPSYFAFYRYVDDHGNPSSMSPISNESLGGPPFTYTGIVPPTESKVAEIQLFRNTAGQATIYYLDGTITNFLQTTFISNLTDAQLQLNLPFAIASVEGDSFLNLYDVPPSWKSCLAYQIGRTFLGVDVEYKRGNARVTFQSTTVVGTDTNWKSNFAGRAFYAVGAPKYYIIDSVDPVAQTLTLTETYGGSTNNFAQYTIRPQPSERRLVYYSESQLPEAWPPTNAIQVHEDGDDITGLVAFNSFLYIVEKRHTYRFTYQSDPAKDGFVFNSTNRGCVNQRCIVLVEDSAWMLDEQGIHKFSGGAANPVSEPIQDLFQPGLADDFSINWSADQTLWHAAWDPERETIRWFVAFGMDPEPRDAICYQYRLNRFWLEHYERPITSSCTGFVDAYRSLVGTTARQILCISQGTLDGVKEDPTFTQGQVVSGGPVTLTLAPTAYAPQGLVGYTVGIMSGRGANQVRTITSISGQKVWVDRPWDRIPDSTSTYQFGAFPYYYQTGWFRFSDDESGNPRDVELVYSPATYNTYVHVQGYYNYSFTPRQWVVDRTLDGVTWSSETPGIQVLMKGYGGYVIMRQEGHREIYIGGDRFTSVALTGVSSLEPIQIRGIIVNGCES